MYKSKYERYRRISVPKVNLKSYAYNPLTKDVIKGVVKAGTYSSIKQSFIVRSYIANILFCCAPAIIFHFVGFGIPLIMTMVSDTFEYPRVSIGAYQTIVIFYGICLFFAFRRIGDHMTFYRNTMLSYKYNINRDFLSKIGADTNSEEFAIMDHNRQEFNKYNLFPSVKEIALESQLYKRTVKAANRAFFDHNKKSIIQSADNRRQRFSIDHKRQEHLAAKRIADWKQNQYGGENEYDVMVAEHQKRTIPEIITIINDVKNQTASM